MTTKKPPFAIECASIQDAPCYLTRGDGDPPRTFDPKHATKYATLKGAQIAMGLTKRRSPLKPRSMKIIEHPAP